MRNLKSIIVTLAASTAILVPATTATASTANTSTAGASSLSGATSSLTCVAFCFDIYVDDVLSQNDVDILNTVSICGVQAVQLQALAIGQSIDCADGHKKAKRSK